MAEKKHPDGAFAAAAEGFDRLARDVKDKELAHTGARRILPEAPGLHPDAAWARAFGIQAVRPRHEAAGFAAPLPERPAPPPPTVPMAPPGNYPGAHIGAALGKPGPRRSFLGRLFRGSGRGI
jgi:hypothetical protein